MEIKKNDITYERTLDESYSQLFNNQINNNNNTWQCQVPISPLLRSEKDCEKDIFVAKVYYNDSVFFLKSDENIVKWT